MARLLAHTLTSGAVVLAMVWIDDMRRREIQRWRKEKDKEGVGENDARKMATSMLHERSLQRVFVAALVVAVKMDADEVGALNNGYYAKVGGLALVELNKLEIEFLFRMNWNLQENIEENFWKMEQLLRDHEKSCSRCGVEKPKEFDLNGEFELPPTKGHLLKMPKFFSMKAMEEAGDMGCNATVNLPESRSKSVGSIGVSVAALLDFNSVLSPKDSSSSTSSSSMLRVVPKKTLSGVFSAMENSNKNGTFFSSSVSQLARDFSGNQTKSTENSRAFWNRVVPQQSGKFSVYSDTESIALQNKDYAMTNSFVSELDSDVGDSHRVSNNIIHPNFRVPKSSRIRGYAFKRVPAVLHSSGLGKSDFFAFKLKLDNHGNSIFALVNGVGSESDSVADHLANSFCKQAAQLKDLGTDLLLSALQIFQRSLIEVKSLQKGAGSVFSVLFLLFSPENVVTVNFGLYGAILISKDGQLNSFRSLIVKDSCDQEIWNAAYAHAFGSSPFTPEVSLTELTNSSQWIIIASPGFWDCISSQQAVDLISQCPSAQSACDRLCLEVQHLFPSRMNEMSCLVFALFST